MKRIIIIVEAHVFKHVFAEGSNMCCGDIDSADCLGLIYFVNRKDVEKYADLSDCIVVGSDFHYVDCEKKVALIKDLPLLELCKN